MKRLVDICWVALNVALVILVWLIVLGFAVWLARQG